MPKDCKFEKQKVGEIEGNGTRFKTSRNIDKKKAGLVPDPKYCGVTEIAKASLERRDPSKSGGGRRF